MLCGARSFFKPLGCAVAARRAIKVLTDLKNRRAAFFYRHIGPSGPKEGLPLQPEPLRRTQTALILQILIILAILLQTREIFRASRPLKIGELRFSIDMKVLTALSGRGDCEGQALALRGPGRFFFVARGLAPASVLGLT